MCKKKKNIYDRVPRAKEILSYYRLWVDGKADVVSQGNPFLVTCDTTVSLSKSEGKEYHVTEEDVIAGLCENEEIRELIYQK